MLTNAQEHYEHYTEVPASASKLIHIIHFKIFIICPSPAEEYLKSDGK